MFKARIVVSEITDPDIEAAAVADRAKRAGLESAESLAMVEVIQSAVAIMKKNFLETSQHGISLHATKTVSGQHYEVTLLTSSADHRPMKSAISSIFAIFKK